MEEIKKIKYPVSTLPTSIMQATKNSPANGNGKQVLVLPTAIEDPNIINAMSAVLAPTQTLLPSTLPNSTLPNSSTDQISLLPPLLSATLGTVSAPLYTFALYNGTTLNDTTTVDQIAASSLLANS